MKVGQHVFIPPIKRFELQPQSFEKFELFPEVFAVEKQENAFYVRVVFRQEAGKGIPDRMGIIDHKVVGLPTLAAPVEIRLAQLEKTRIGLQIFPESTLQQQVVGGLPFGINQIQLPIDDRCDAQFGSVVETS